MKEHQPIGIDYQQIHDDDYIEDLMTQYYMGLMKIVETSQDFRITLFLKQSLINSIKSTRQPLTR